jgi:hypothetical protein
VITIATLIAALVILPARWMRVYASSSLVVSTTGNDSIVAEYGACFAQDLINRRTQCQAAQTINSARLMLIGSITYAPRRTSWIKPDHEFEISVGHQLYLQRQQPVYRPRSIDKSD